MCPWTLNKYYELLTELLMSVRKFNNEPCSQIAAAAPGLQWHLALGLIREGWKCYKFNAVGGW